MIYPLGLESLKCLLSGPLQKKFAVPVPPPIPCPNPAKTSVHSLQLCLSDPSFCRKPLLTTQAKDRTCLFCVSWMFSVDLYNSKPHAAVVCLSVVCCTRVCAPGKQGLCFIHSCNAKCHKEDTEMVAWWMDGSIFMYKQRDAGQET